VDGDIIPSRVFRRVADGLYVGGNTMKCPSCIYSPGTHGDENCPFDCGAMEAGYLTHKNAPSGFVVGRVVPSQAVYVPANPLNDVMIDDTTMVVYSEPARKGWICPKCDNAVSPDEKTCPHCKPKPKKESDGGERTHITESD